MKRSLCTFPHRSLVRNREARHPNVVLYLGLSRAPPSDGRIFIISEYIENGIRSVTCFRASEHSRFIRELANVYMG